MLTRSGLDRTARFRPIAAALAVPKIRAAYLDGEIAVLGEDGVTSFAALQDALSRPPPTGARLLTPDVHQKLDGASRPRFTRASLQPRGA